MTNHPLSKIPFLLSSADSEPFSSRPLNACTGPAASSPSSVFPTLTGAAGDNFSLSSDSSAGKSTRQYCLTWLPLTGIFGTIFLCHNSFLPCWLALNVKPSSEMAISHFMLITLCMQKQRRGNQSWPYQTLRGGRHARNQKSVTLYFCSNHSKFIWKRCNKQ